MSAIAGRLDDHSLQEDGKEFRRVRNSHSLRIELKLLWTYNSLQASPAAAINDNDLNLLELLSRETEIDGSRSPPGERHLAAHLVAGVSRGGGHQRQLF
ncbi:hypothetical protein CP49_04610 [Bradyrhizobium valentinum]|uniref:Uncharacterized protein n=1 Tax=Bradyrhizobium valentinum TaxID=1518501 RepID=A0A0R3L2S9_9BRAD|nr:hypothetical protein CP49_04610 [Bradyrhizobium valentinum]